MTEPQAAADPLAEPSLTPEAAEPANVPQEDDQPRRVRVPIRPGAGPFAQPEYAEVDPDATGQWSLAVWHNEPPG